MHSRSVLKLLALMAIGSSAPAYGAILTYTTDVLYGNLQSGLEYVSWRKGAFFGGPDVVGSLGEVGGAGPWARISHDGPGGTFNLTAEAKNGCCDSTQAVNQGHADARWLFEFSVSGNDATFFSTPSRAGGPTPPFGVWRGVMSDLTTSEVLDGGTVWPLIDGHAYRFEVLVASMTAPSGDYGYGSGTIGATFSNATFRSASVPEPSSLALLAAALLGVFGGLIRHERPAPRQP